MHIYDIELGMKTYIAILSLLNILSTTLIAGEVDQFTKRFSPPADSSVEMNKVANHYLKKSIIEANGAGEGCDEKVLYKKMRNYFANHKDGEITIHALTSPTVARTKFKISESIFQGWTMGTGALIGRPNADNTDVALSPLITIGNQVIGTDKLEHLFGRGFAYFTDYYLSKKSLRKTLKTGIFEEKIIYGGNFLTTGVFSYADLATNFDGMRFWNHVLLKREDILGATRNLGPYVVCKDKKFVLNKKIDFTNYFDAAHDEGINCSKFANDKGLKKFNESLVKLTAKDPDHTYECPMDQSVLDKVVEKYGEFAKFLVNQNGNNTVNYTGEFTQQFRN